MSLTQTVVAGNWVDGMSVAPLCPIIFIVIVMLWVFAFSVIDDALQAALGEKSRINMFKNKQFFT